MTAAPRSEHRGVPEAGFFAELATRLHAQPGARATVERIAEDARDATGSDGAAVSLRVAGGRLAVAAATDDVARAAEQLQQRLEQGPSFAAVGEPDPVVSPSADRFPRWSPAVRDLGFRSAFAVRLQARDRTIGALSLYSRAADAFGRQDAEVAEIFAMHAAVALDSSREEEGLQRAMDSRALIGQAQGILMERYGLDADRAFLVLKRYSQDANLKLIDVARQVARTRRLPEA